MQPLAHRGRQRRSSPPRSSELWANADILLKLLDFRYRRGNHRPSRPANFLSSGDDGMSEACEFTILMPCLNEAETLASCISKARAFLARSGCTGEVVIADNGSTDGSQAIAAANGARVVHVAERGYGSALLAGIRAAHGKFVIMGDSDDSYDFSRLDAFVEQLRTGYQLVMGNRYRGGILRGAMPPLHRYLGNPLLTAIGGLFFRTGCGDVYCGLRGFDRRAILALDLQARGMEFALEMLVKAAVLGLWVHRGAAPSVTGRAWPAAASAAMARRLAQFAVFPAVQPALAVPLSRVRPLCRRLSGDGLAAAAPAAVGRGRL